MFSTYFVICAPETKHMDLDDVCDVGTYQRRMWCRAEQVCHSMRNGRSGMYVASGKTDNFEFKPVESDFFIESLHVFNGQLTCCRFDHKVSIWRALRICFRIFIRIKHYTYSLLGHGIL